MFGYFGIFKPSHEFLSSACIPSLDSDATAVRPAANWQFERNPKGFPHNVGIDRVITYSVYLKQNVYI